MNKQHWLVLDATFMCYRAFHAMGGLEFGEVGTAVPFGVFRDILSLKDQFPGSKFVFCFDRGKPKRKDVYPGYKGDREKKREEAPEEEKEARKELKRQMRLLATDYLPGCGFANIQWAHGYEADDLIASFVLGLPPGVQRATIVGADNDLWQLLSPYVRMWNPVSKKLITQKSFRNQHGIEPTMWADVKAIAGCSSDSVEGVAGVGDKYAARYLAGTLKPTTKAFEKIAKASDMWKSNLKLTRLPYEGTPTLEIKEDSVTKTKWARMAKRLGMDSIRDQTPEDRAAVRERRRERVSGN